MFAYALITLIALGWLVLGYYMAKAEAEYDRVAESARAAMNGDVALMNYLANRAK